MKIAKVLSIHIIGLVYDVFFKLPVMSELLQSYPEPSRGPRMKPDCPSPLWPSL
jgi:hypothetical protein